MTSLSRFPSSCHLKRILLCLISFSFTLSHEEVSNLSDWGPLFLYNSERIWAVGYGKCVQTQRANEFFQAVYKEKDESNCNIWGQWIRNKHRKCLGRMYCCKLHVLFPISRNTNKGIILKQCCLLNCVLWMAKRLWDWTRYARDL